MLTGIPLELIRSYISMLVTLLPEHHISQSREELNFIQEPFILKLSFTTLFRQLIIKHCLVCWIEEVKPFFSLNAELYCFLKKGWKGCVDQCASPAVICVWQSRMNVCGFGLPSIQDAVCVCFTF